MIAQERQVEVQFEDWINFGECSGDPSDLARHVGARRWALNEVGAAVAHQITDPLTALLLYLHEIKRANDALPEGASSTADAIVNGAIRETERVCAIMERIGNSFDGPRDSNLALVRGREAIGWLKRTSVEDGPSWVDRSRFQALTEQEREVLRLISGSESSRTKVASLKFSSRAFETHRKKIMRKLGAKNSADLIRMALLDR